MERSALSSFFLLSFTQVKLEILAGEKNQAFNCIINSLK